MARISWLLQYQADLKSELLKFDLYEREICFFLSSILIKKEITTRINKDFLLIHFPRGTHLPI